MVPDMGRLRAVSGLAIVCATALTLLCGCNQRPIPKPTQEPEKTGGSSELLGAPTPPPASQTTASAVPATSVPPGDAATEADATPPQPDPLRPPEATMAPIPDPDTRTAANNAARNGAAQPTVATAGALLPQDGASGPATVHRSGAVATAGRAALVPAAPAATEAANPVAPSEPGAMASQGDHPEDRGPRADSFEQAARLALGGNSQLTLPPRAVAGQRPQATLVLSAKFGAALRQALASSGLADQGVPVNVTATLTAPGFKTEPSGPQSISLKAGEPVEFHWTVNPTGTGRGPSPAKAHAEICIEVPVGSDPICIGQVAATPPGPKVSSQVLGAILLIVIVGLAVAWLASSRRVPPSRSVAARRAARQAALLADSEADSAPAV
jgi:hypothetical protein